MTIRRPGIRFLGVLGLGIAVSIAIVTVAVDDPSTTQAGGAAFVVDSTVDAVDAIPGDGVCNDGGGNCTLRAAIMEANALAGADSITLPAGMYKLDIVGSEDEGVAGDLDILGDLDIVGASADTVVIDGEGIEPGRLVQVTESVSATLSGMTLRNGSMYGPAGSRGGGIYNAGEVTLSSVVLTNNGAYLWGGAIFNEGTLVLENSTLTLNGTAGAAGAIWNAGQGTADIYYSAIIGNGTTGGGEGGGIGNDGSMTIVNTTVTSNTTLFGRGGGIGNSGALSITDSTVAYNVAGSVEKGFAVEGGGISQGGGTLTVRNSIVADNLNGAGQATDCSGTINSLGYNLIEDTSSCTIVGDTTGNITGVDPLLGPLADNGGPTQTHALLPGSPAIDAGDDANCPATDQRGIPRPQGAGCDIGAVEAASTLVGGTSAGASEINVTDEGSFELGDTIVINPGGDTEETNEVIGFGSLLLADPLQFSHEAGEAVAKVASATPAPTSTPTPSPTPSGETASATPTPTPTPTPTGTPGPVLAQGDNDCDGDTDSVDALTGLRYVAAIGFSQEEGCPVLGDALPAALPAGEPPDLFGDVDCDDDVDAVDQLKILQSVAAIPFTQNEPCTDIGKPL